jgi:hypothetical protein
MGNQGNPLEAPGGMETELRDARPRKESRKHLLPKATAGVKIFGANFFANRDALWM